MSTFAEAVQIATAKVGTDLAAFAKAENAKIMGADPRPLNFTRWVDGIKDAPEENVQRIIVYQYNRYDQVAQFVLDLLRQRSPVKSGDYVRSHTLFLNGVEVQTLDTWQDGDEISITNYVPYSRKLEVGTHNGKKIKLSVSPHIYETTAQIARNAYRGIADISFTYRGIVAGAQINALNVGALSSKRGARGRFASQGGGSAHNKSDVRYPTITINPPGSFRERAGLD